MSEAKKAINEALGGFDPAKVTPPANAAPEGQLDCSEDVTPEIDWSQYGDVEDLDPEHGYRRKRGVKPTGAVPSKQAFVETSEDQAIMETLGDDAPHNYSLPELRIQQEKTDHRFIVYLFAQGKSVREVFTQLGGKMSPDNKPLPVKQHGGKYSYAHLTQLRRQPWFQKQVIDLMKEQGVDAVEAAMKAEVENSVATIIEVRDNVDEKGSTRLAAANSLLDRILGKPTQKIEKEVTTKTLGQLAEDKDQIDKELEAIEAEIVAFQPAPVREIE